MHRKDDKAESTLEVTGPRPSEEENGWFTVSRAAELLSVPVTRIFDNIRDGRLRVRFRPNSAGDGERPFVTSDELLRLANPSGALIARPGNATANGDGAAVKEASALELAAETKLKETLEAERSSRKAAEELLSSERLRRSEMEEKLLEERRNREEMQRAIDAERTVRHELERSAVAAGTRAKEVEGDLERTRSLFDEAEDKLDASLKAIYDRDVKIARLESQVEAAKSIQEAGNQFVDQLQQRITRIEDRAEEKEKEIRRLALGLGEARGEIRLLCPPPDAVGSAIPWWKRLMPWGLCAALAFLAFWISYQLASSNRVFEAGLVSVVALFLALAYGWVKEKFTSKRWVRPSSE